MGDLVCSNDYVELRKVRSTLFADIAGVSSDNNSRIEQS